MPLSELNDDRTEREKSPSESDEDVNEFLQGPTESLEGIHHHAHWEGLSESEEESDIDMSEPEDNVIDDGKNVFETMMQTRKIVENNKWGDQFLYQRGPTGSDRHQRGKRAAAGTRSKQVVIASSFLAAGRGSGFRG